MDHDTHHIDQQEDTQTPVLSHSDRYARGRQAGCYLQPHGGRQGGGVAGLQRDKLVTLTQLSGMNNLPMSNKGETDMTNSQNTKILAHLRATKGLTLREAMLDYSIQSFTKRISELRKAGYRIDGVKGKHPVTGQQYTRYVLIEETV